MLHKCANPACPNPFRYLRQGKLFQVETDDFTTSISGLVTPKRGRLRSLRRVEYYWLCDECSSVFTLTSEKGRGMITVPLPAGKKKVTPLHLGSVRAPTEQVRSTGDPGEA